MKIVIGNDHAGVEFKNKIMKALRSKGHEIINVGTDTLDSVDYPDIAKEVSKKIINKEYKNLKKFLYKKKYFKNTKNEMATKSINMVKILFNTLNINFYSLLFSTE